MTVFNHFVSNYPRALAVFAMAVLATASLLGSPAIRAQEPGQNGNSGKSHISWAEDQRQYVEGLQKLYQTPDATEALTRHINNLLKFYAYGDERIIASSRLGTPSRHRIHTSDRGEIVSFNKFGTAEDEPFKEDRFSVYGVNPYLEYSCSERAGSCWIMHPVTSERWLQIVGNQDTAEELTKAFAQLIKRMQKAG